MVILLAAGLLAGCSHDDEPTLEHEIVVRSGVSGLQKRVRSILNSDSLQAKDIKIDAYYVDTETKFLDGKKLHYDAGHDPSPAWVFWDGTAQEHYYWPFEGSKTSTGGVASTLDFVGFCPYDKPAYIGEPSYDHTTGVTFTCDISSYLTNVAQRTMQEYVIAVENDQTYAIQEAEGGALPMVFKHPLALVKFVIAPASGTNVTIDSIAIAGLHTSGTCAYDGTTMSWSDYSGSETMTLQGLSLQVGTAKTESDSLMVIPDNYGAKTLSVRGSWTEWSEVENHTVSADVDFSWQPGYLYVYRLTVSKYALKVDVDKYTEQW